MKCIGVLQITLKSITKKDEYKDKLIDIDEGLFGPDEPLTNLINNLGKIIGSSYLILSDYLSSAISLCKMASLLDGRLIWFF